MKQAVLAGLGIGIASRSSVEMELQTARLVVVNVLECRCAVPLYSIHHRQKRLTAAQQAFIDQIRTEGNASDMADTATGGPSSEEPPV